MSSLFMRDRLLTRLFLRRFLDNDLVSPDADRRETLTTLSAALITAGLFVTVLLSLKYLFNPFQTPGYTAALALDDRVFHIGCAMIVSALAAVAEWDALALDERETLILGPLPIPARAIVRAKLGATAIFAAAFALALNLVPSVLHPLLMVAKLPVGLSGLMTLVAAHAATTMAAGLFGFLTVVAIREVLWGLLRANHFRRVSAFVQTFLLVSLSTTFLLLPILSSGIATSKLTPGQATIYVVPPFWFLGLQETMAGSVIDGLPRPPLPPGIQRSEDEATKVYRSLARTFHEMARLAVAALALVALLSLSGFWWNRRRLPAPGVGRAAERRWIGAITSVANRIVVPRMGQQAGFFFALKTLWRSGPHRLILAISAAAGVGTATVTLWGVEVNQTAQASSIAVQLFAVQTMLITILIVGLRHAIRVPADLRASWVFQMAWSANPRAYVDGVKRAGAVALALPVLTVLFGFHLMVWGTRLAVLHLACGLLLTLVLLEVLLYKLDKPPFVCAYEPAANLKALGPIYLVAFVILTQSFARLERLALDGGLATAAFFVAMTAGLLCLRALDARHRRDPVAFELDEPARAVQRLDLTE